MRSNDEFFLYRLPYSVPETYEVSSHFYLTPLTHSLLEEADYYVLSLSPECVQLFRGNNVSLSPIDLPPGVPQSLSDEESYVQSEFQASQQVHTTSQLTPSSISVGVGHGHVDQRNDRQDEFVQFLHRINHHLEPILTETPLPLFIAATTKHQSEFREISRFPLLQSVGIDGNPDGLQGQELLAVALPLYRMRQREERISFWQFYRDHQHTPRVSDDPSEIVDAAQQGRVQTLATSIFEQRWGKLDQW